MTKSISFRQLQVFIEVAKIGTVAGAAQKINLSQSATSQSLSLLEDQLGVMLFERIGKRLTLNDVGKRLLPQAELLIRHLEKFAGLASEPDNIIQGSLIITTNETIGTYLLPWLIAKFCQQYPHADIKIRLKNSKEIMSDLLKFEADIGLGMADGHFYHAKLSKEAWRNDELVIAASPKHYLTRKPSLHINDLANAHWILRSPDSGVRRCFETAILQKINHLNIRMELERNDTIKQAIKANLGLGALPKLSIENELKRGELIALKHGLDLTRQFSILWHPERYHTPLWQAFIVFLRENLTHP